MVRAFLLIVFFFISFNSGALVLDKIFQFNDTASLKAYIKNYKHRHFLNLLCKKQKENRKPPVACYELFSIEDTFCLGLKLKDINLEIVNLALKSKFLSLSCRNYLVEKQKILLYREKDFLLPALKNYWTYQKPFPYKKGDAPFKVKD